MTIFLKTLAWLTGSKFGKWLSIGIILILGLLLFALRIKANEASEQRLKEAQEALRRLRERIKTDETIARLPADERRRRLSDDWAK